MNCKNCGCKIEENQKFCTKCGTEITETKNIEQDFKLSKKIIAIIIISIVSLPTLAIGTRYMISHNKNLANNILQSSNKDNLNKIWRNDEVLFIDDFGNEILKFKYDENTYYGEFREGRVFVAKTSKTLPSITEEPHDYSAITELSILDKNGNVVKTFDKKVFVTLDDTETSASYLPEFYKGYALIRIIDDKDLNKKEIEYSNIHIKEVYIDKNGKEVKNIPDNVKKMLSDRHIMATRFETNDLEYKEMPCIDNSAETCVGYIDKNNDIKLKPIFDYTHLQCGDWYGTNPKFINHYALVYTRAENEPKVGNYTILSGGYRFIDSSGNFINNELYDYAQPFYGNLAYVRINNKYGFINKQGKWVWSAIDNSQNKFVQMESVNNEQGQIEQEKQDGKSKIIEKYNSLNFDKEKMLKAYKDSNDYCKTQNCISNGAYIICQDEYLKEYYPELHDSYVTIYDYCLNVRNSNSAEMFQCIENEILLY